MTTKNKPVIIAVDGPAGSGKSSICAQVAAALGFTYLNTGLLYRAAAFLATREGVELTDEKALAIVVERVAAGLQWEPSTQKLFYQGEDLAPALVSTVAAAGASLVAKSGIVREKLLPVQRKLALLSPLGAILDGRDIGTVVFPDADLKIYLTASLAERARRRLRQLSGQSGSGPQPPLEEMMAEIKRRDEQDSQRAVAPLKKAADAVEIDNSDFSQEETLGVVIDLIKQKLSGGGKQACCCCK